MRRLLRAPALHFLVSGALLLAAEPWLASRGPEPQVRPAPIEIDAARLSLLRENWLARAGAAADAPALEALVATEIDEEVLVAEARARGLERDDPVVRARLARNLGFLDAQAEDAKAGAAARVDEALSLGLARGDLVVRRRLIERMRAELAADGAGEPSEAEVAARFARDPSRFASPARVRVSHVFLSRDRRGAALDADARALRKRLEADGIEPSTAIALGDPFLLGHDLPLRSQADLGRDFGETFARAVFALEPGVISAPIASSYGLHLVVVRERRSATPATLGAARGEVVAELVRERETARLRASLDALRTRYEIRVAQVEP